MNGDLVVGVSDQSSDALNLLFNSDVGRSYLSSCKGLTPPLVDSLSSLGLSGIANVLAAIKTARRLELDERDVIITVATDSARLYVSERDRWKATRFPKGFDETSAAEVFGEHLLSPDGDHVLEMTHRDRRRIFNLGYFTWVEQQGVHLEDFEQRSRQQYWRGLRDFIPAWDQLIERFNRETGLAQRAGIKA